MPLFVLIIAVSVFFSAVPSQVHAASETVCVGYARHAVKEAIEAQRLGCGFTGPRWSTDYRAHFDWCEAPKANLFHTRRFRAVVR